MLYAVPTLLVESIEAQHNDMMKKERRKRRRDDNNPNFESLSASASITVRDTCRALIYYLKLVRCHCSTESLKMIF
jgi:hypothetical protein